MKKLIKIVGIIISVSITFLIVAAIAITIFFDPNDYKEDISALVKEETGRTFAIEGDLSLTLFPWVGIQTGAVRLGNAPGFGDSPFASVEQVGVKVQLMPLFSKKLVMDTITLEGLSLNLVRKSNGATNWQDLGGKTRQEVKTKKDDDHATEMTSLDISGINVSGAKLGWEDQQAGKKFSIENISLNTGRLGTGKPVDLELGMTVKGTDLKKPVTLSFEGTLDLNMQKHTLVISDMEFQLADLKLTGDLKGSGFPKKPVFSGNLKAAEFAPGELLQRLGVALPKTRDASVFGKATVKTEFNFSTDSLKLNELVASLDDTTLKGTLAVTGFASPAINFKLDLDEIDIDRYLAPTPDKPTGKPAVRADASAELLPVKLLRKLNINGTATISKMKAYNLRSEQIIVSVKASDGNIRIHPAKANMYQGSYYGDVAINVRGATPVLSMNETLSGVQAEPLMKDLAELDFIEGKADMSTKLTARGNTMKALRGSLNGNIRFAFENGAIKGINIPLLLRKTYAKLKGLPAPPDEPQKTDFTELTGTAVIKDGVVHNNDLKASSPLLRIDGKGTADLVNEQLNYAIKTSVVATLQGQGGDNLDKLKGLSIPVKVTGSFQDPKYKVDVDKVVSTAAKKKIKEKLKRKVEEKLEKKLDDKLKNKLKGLLGK